VPSKRRHAQRELAGRRAAAQLLHRPGGRSHPADVARAICGAQAQDARAGRLAFRARAAKLTSAAVDRARVDERSLLRTWAMRKTMHLIATDDAGWMLPLFEPRIEAWSRRRLEQLGIGPRDQDQALREVRRALGADGPLLRAELAELIAGRGVELDTSTRMHVAIVAVTSGIACLGPDRGGQTCLAPRRDWIGEPPAFNRDAALAELARRYLAAFGPATDADFAGWAGLGLRDVRAGLGAIARELTEVGLGGKRGWRLRRVRRRPGRGVVRLLPPWDTYLMGYRDRGFIAPPDRWAQIATGGGMLHPTIVRDGVAIGLWRSKRAGGRTEVSVEPFEELDAATAAAIDAEIEDVRRFEGTSAGRVA
jgi:DNA glycosylase AlkZ-like